MQRLYFPPCPVEGPIEPPVPFGHMGTTGAIPNKCGHCKLQFEGGCLRVSTRFMHLDYGPCGIHGPTDPVFIENDLVHPGVEVPRKRSSCVHFFHDHIHGLICNKDQEKWGGFPRGLDWGTWEPEWIYLDIPLPRRSSKALIGHAYKNESTPFILEHRRLNPDLPLTVAREDFAMLRRQIDAHSSDAAASAGAQEEEAS